MLTILLVESDRCLRQILKEALQAAKWQVIATESRETGLQLATECIPDAIVCDAMFPVELNKFLDRLHENPLTTDIPIVVLATTTTIERIFTSIYHQTTYCVKPFNIAILLETLSSVCRSSRETDTIVESLVRNFQNPAIQFNIA
jgi:two-component system phosphate regulon response regulator PhoB